MVPANENGPVAKPIEDLVIAGSTFKMYEVPGHGLIVDGEDTERFMARTDLTPEIAAAVKEAVLERVNAWLQHATKPSEF